MHRSNSHFLELAEVLLEHGALPVTSGVLVHGGELRRVTVEYLANSASELLSTPEGTVGDIDIDGQ